MVRKSLKWTLIYVLEAIVVLITLAIFGLGAIFWRLSSGPFDLDFFRADAQAMIADVFEGDVVALGELSARYDAERSALVVTAADVSVAQANGELVARAPRIEAGVAVGPLLFGRIEPVSLSINGGSISVVRRADGAVGAGLGGVERVRANARQPEGGSDDSASLFALLQDPQTTNGGLGQLSFVQVENASVRIVDELSGIAWLVNDAGVVLDRNESRILTELHGELATPSGFAQLDIRLQAGAALNALLLEARINNLSLATVAPDQGPLAILGGLDAPLSFDLVMDARRDSGIRTASLELEVGAGRILSQGVDREFRGAQLALDFDPVAGALTVTRGEVDSDVVAGSLSGQISELGGYIGALPTEWVYQFEAGPGFVDMGEIFSRPPRWEGLTATGSADLSQRRLVFDALDFQLDGVSARLSGETSLSEVEEGRWLPNLRLEGPVEGDITVDTVLAYWPVELADGARSWIVDGILGGRFYNAQIFMDIDAASIAEGALANDRLNLSFDVENARVRYISTMTPITEGMGRAVLYGNAFEAYLTGGRIGEIELIDGYVDIPRLNPKGAMARYGGRARGQASDILALIDEEPLGFPSDYGIDPASVGGAGEVEFEIRRAMLTEVAPEDIPFVIRGSFADASISVPDTPFALSEGVVDIEVEQGGLLANGTAVLADTPVSIVWRENFQADEETPSTTFELSADVGARALDLFGIPARRYLSGQVALEARARSNGLDIDSIDLDADLTNAVLEAPESVWVKEAGVPGMAGFTLTRNDDGDYVFEEILAQTEGVDVAASAVLSQQGRLVEAVIDQLHIEGFMDIGGRLAAPAEEGAPFTARLSGEYVDAREILQHINRFQGGEEGVPLSLTFDVASLVVSDSSVLNDFSVIWRSEAEGVRAASISGRSDAGPFFANFGAVEDGGRRELRIETQSLERLSGLLGYDGYIRGGQMSVLGEAPPLGVPGPLEARVEIDNLILVEVPVLARILAAGSFEGLGALLNGDGIRFENVDADIMLQDQLLTVGEAQATGSSLGVTAAGTVDFAGELAAIDGNLAPSYAVNSMLGDLPVIGDILVSRPGEGIFGITYSVEGPFDSLTVFANPLSVIAPGVFRRIFEGTAAERAAREREAEAEDPPLPNVLPPELLEQLQRELDAMPNRSSSDNDPADDPAPETEPSDG
ncbi:AsmA-like C-terminal region-containing protein [Maricaulis sp.]|uniref:YhdP family protein n=1 Tax=Maricaulis sp. TaxID=1486257 RepID=UPI0026285DCF|nr:AsmA-like C-terminal region-containing protein [Maricaulis sp.]